jgi:hypothetical protein
MAGAPCHEHDCDTCRFIGTVGPEPGEGDVNAVDEYLCRSPRDRSPTLIRRCGSDPGDYGSWPMAPGLCVARYRGTAERATAAGLASAAELAAFLAPP